MLKTKKGKIKECIIEIFFITENILSDMYALVYPDNCLPLRVSSRPYLVI